MKHPNEQSAQKVEAHRKSELVNPAISEGRNGRETTQKPSVVGIEMHKKDDSLIVDGEILIVGGENASMIALNYSEVAQELHYVKHLFNGDHKKVPARIRNLVGDSLDPDLVMNITYIFYTKADDTIHAGQKVVVSFLANMQEGMTSYRKTKVLNKKGNRMIDSRVPLEFDEHNQIMWMFGATCVQVLDAYFERKEQEAMDAGKKPVYYGMATEVAV